LGLTLAGARAQSRTGVAGNSAAGGAAAPGAARPRAAAPNRAPRTGEWRTYGADLANTRYAPLDQITADNFKSLAIAWRFPTTVVGADANFQATPLMVDGVVFTTAGSHRAVVALDAVSGEMLWMHREDEGRRAEQAPRKQSGRGLAYWSDGQSARIVYVTPGYRMVALDARTGIPVSGFGDAGIVDLKLGDDQQMDLVTGEIGLQSAPVIAGNTVIIGASHLEGGAPKSRTNQKGYVRAFDVRTGKRLWIFHTIPVRGEPGYETWENGSAEYTGNTGVWTQISVDEQLGLVYLPVETPTGDYYGGHRPGNGLYGESLVAVDLQTGKRKWHYQFVHHGLWDMDIPCAPILADVMIDGRMRKIAAQATKQAWLYVLDRETGEPIWPIVERPVPQSDVPGEKSSPTQPFVTKPPAFDRQGVTLNDLIDFTPELHAQAVKLVSRFKLGPLFTPPIVSRWEGPVGTLALPNVTGGANWEGGSLDPETNTFYIFSNTNVSTLALSPGGQRSDMAYLSGQAANPDNPKSPPVTTNVQGLPLIKPPYGRITAIDLSKGDILWQIAHGETPDNIRNHPALKGLTIPRTGRPGRVGTLVTKTLLIAGEGGFFTLPDGRRGAMLRAYDKATGVERGAVYMPAPVTGSPMTYMRGGKQYVVVAVSGQGFPGELLAYRLP
jgi:quinoprotein glucose dehydrogenase